jgi:[ribosomal protein S5]-alanine N-acetyltransferase
MPDQVRHDGNDMTELRTPRLLLRRARPDDLAGLHAVLSDERAMTYWSSGPHATIQQTQEWLDGMIASTPEESEDFVITYDGETIGKIGAYRLPDFGYILAPRHWGLGLASEAMTAFLDHAFSRPDIDRLTADVDPRNHASLQLLKRFGFVETGRGSGTWTTPIGVCDSIYFALGKADHLSRNSGPRHDTPTAHPE